MNSAAYSAAQIAELAGSYDRHIRRRANRESWVKHPRYGRGGGSVYVYEGLPDDIRLAIAGYEGKASLEAVNAPVLQIPAYPAYKPRTANKSHQASKSKARKPGVKKAEVKKPEVLPDGIRKAIAGQEAISPLIAAKATALARAQSQEERKARTVVLMNQWQAAKEWRQNKADARYRILEALGRYLMEVPHKRKTAGEVLFARLYNNRTNQFIDDADIYKQIPKVSPQSMRRWRSTVNKTGIPGLMNKAPHNYNKHTSVSLSIQQNIIGYILEQPHIRPAHLHEIIVKMYQDTSERIPSRSSIYRFVNDWKAKNARVYTLAADPVRYKTKYMPAFGSKSAGITHFCHTWEIDSTRADLITSDGKRCAIIVAIDVYSRRCKIVVSPTSKSAAIAALLRNCLLDWGTPKYIRMDNGKDYRSKHITAIVKSLNIEPIYCRPYTPDDKPFVERVIGTLVRGLHELLPGYCGHSVAERKRIVGRAKVLTALARRLQPGEVRAPVTVSLTMKQLQEMTDRWVHYYDNRVHSSLKVPPLVQSRVGEQPAKIRDIRALDVLLAPVASRTVAKRGLQIDNAVYTHELLAEHVGELVEIRRDMADAGKIYVFAKLTEAGGNETLKFICVAVDAGVSGISLDSYQEARSRKLKRDRETLVALKTFSENLSSPTTVLLPTAEILKNSSRVVGFQTTDRQESIVQASQAFVETKEVLGLAQSLGGCVIGRNDSSAGESKDKQPDLAGQKVLAMPNSRNYSVRPFFQNDVEAWDWFTEKKANLGSLPPEEQAWLDELLAKPSIKIIVDLKRETDLIVAQKTG